jgi:hypothetical protein
VKISTLTKKSFLETKNPFCKINFTGENNGNWQGGLSFINYPLEFDFPISYLNELDIYFTYPDGSLVDFRNIEHSFTLRIIEKIITPTNTGLNSKDINVIDTLKSFTD